MPCCCMLGFASAVIVCNCLPCVAEGSVHIVRQYPFTAERKMMSTIVSLDPSNPINGPVRVYVSGVCAKP